MGYAFSTEILTGSGVASFSASAQVTVLGQTGLHDYLDGRQPLFA